MPVFPDPEDTETKALHDYADFSGKRVLEIGCGDGRLTWRYADRVAHAVAIDPKAEDIEIAIDDCPVELREKGVAEEKLSRVHAPIGLELNAETPEEIAVSIMAEIIMLRNSGTGKPMKMAQQTTDHGQQATDDD